MNFNESSSKNNLKDFIEEIMKIIKGPKRMKKKGTKYSLLIIIIGAIFFYFATQPPINIHSRQSWVFIGAILVAFFALFGANIKNKKIIKIFLFLFLFSYIILNLIGIKPFNAKRYSNIIQIKESNFTEDVDELPTDKIPTLDRDSSERLGSRKMGEILELVSQFDIDNTYSQVNYKNRPYRVTPLKYNGFLKYIFNAKDGLPGYITVDIVNGKTELIKLKDKIKYSNGDYFFRNIRLYTRLKYPFDILGDFEFEIDENGIPFWVIPTYSPKIAWFDGLDVKNVILINAINGEHEKYPVENAPKWIDRIYKADDIIEQLDWHGLYQGGFINSMLSQKNVLKTTDGYNYLALKDDVFLYTGFTSVAEDASNVGFILTNLRTKQTSFYPVPSAEEFSAMDSAEGAVQEKEYRATFPLLLNLNTHPTYFLSLKDNAGLIKLYAFIDAKNYQRVSIGSTVEEALAKHKSSTLLIDNKDEIVDILEAKGTISSISSVVIEGNTHYYFTLDGSDKIYVTSVVLSEKLPFLKIGDNIKFSYTEKNINELLNIKSIN